MPINAVYEDPLVLEQSPVFNEVEGQFMFSRDKKSIEEYTPYKIMLTGGKA